MRRALAVLAGVASLATASPLGAQESPPILYTTTVYRGTATSEIFTVVPGGEPVRLTDDDLFDFDPAWSPDRSKIAYVHHAEPRNPDIWVMEADGSDKRRLTRGPRDDEMPQWSPDGTRIAWLKTRGDGVLGRIFVMGADGSDKTFVVDNSAVPQWSPDGTRLAYMHKRPCDCVTDWELRVVDLATGSVIRLTDNRADDLFPVWSPDGTRLVFTRMARDGGGALLTISPDGSDVDRLRGGRALPFAPDWSPDGREIAFSLLVDEGNFETALTVIDVETKVERRIVAGETGGVTPKWSPDGSRIAFLGFREGSWDIYVIAPDGSGMEQVTATQGDEGELDW